jgi:hypothetical protein
MGRFGILKYAVGGVAIAVGLISFSIFYPLVSASLGQSGILSIQLTDPPVTPPGVTSVYVKYSDIFVHATSSSSSSSFGLGPDRGWYKVAQSGSIDLMTVINASETLGTSQIPVGAYDQIRFNITFATITYESVVYPVNVPNGWIRVPLQAGTIYVTSTSDSAAVLDVAPTVVAVNDQGTLRFVLMPAVRAFPVPGAFSKELEQPGATVSNSDRKFLIEDESDSTGRILISKVFLSVNYLAVTVKNIGTTNATLSTVFLEGSNQYSITLGSLTVKGNVTSYQTFGILSNGTLEVANDYSQLTNEFQSGGLGYRLLPGQSVILSYMNTTGIALIIPSFTDFERQGTLVGQMELIIPGNEYYVTVRGFFNTHASTLVKAG